MSYAFGFFVVALVLLVLVVSGSLRVVDRILTGDWGLHPQCAPASRGAAAGE